jgi:alkylhydroperoxidase family enzyme
VIRELYQAAQKAQKLTPAAASDAVAARIHAVAGLSQEAQVVLSYVVRLTLAPATMRAEHLVPLRTHGLSDREVHDTVQVVACFAFMNRLADGTGVTLMMAERHALATELFGREILEQHLAWGRSEAD